MIASWWGNFKTKYISQDDALKGILASAGAGLAGRLFCHPMDTIKAQLQSGRIDVVGKLQLNVQGLYRGLGVTLIGGASVCISCSSVRHNTWRETK